MRTRCSSSTQGNPHPLSHHAPFLESHVSVNAILTFLQGSKLSRAPRSPLRTGAVQPAFEVTFSPRESTSRAPISHRGVLHSLDRSLSLRGVPCFTGRSILLWGVSYLPSPSLPAPLYVACFLGRQATLDCRVYFSFDHSFALSGAMFSRARHGLFRGGVLRYFYRSLPFRKSPCYLRCH